MAVSVIIPCYKQAHLLSDALGSLLDQTYTNLEIVVVDDGSDDHVDAVVRSFHNSKIKCYRKENGGLSSARNFGISHSLGEYLLFLDADDKLKPDAISQLTVILESHPESDMAVMRFVDFDCSSNEFAPSVELEDLTVNSLKTIINRNISPIHCILFRRSTIADNLFDESLRSCEDWDLNSRLICRGAKISTCSYIGAMYRRHHASMSSDIKNMLYYRVVVLINTISYLNHSNQLRREWNTILTTTERLYRRCNYHSELKIKQVRNMLHQKIASYGLSYRGCSWYRSILARIKSTYDAAFRKNLASKYRTGYL